MQYSGGGQAKVPTFMVEELFMDHYQSFCNALRRRGGDMILVRMPTSGEQWERDENVSPKIQSWD